MARKQAGTLWLPARLDFRRFRKELREDLPKEAKEGGKQAARELATGLRAEFGRSLGAARDQLTKGLIDENEFKKQSKKAATALLDGLRAEFNRSMGAARENLARGLINRDEFRRISQQASREFNAGLIPVLKDMQKAGEQNTEEYNRLQRSLKNVGTTGRRAGQEAAQGMSLARRAAEGLKSMALGAVTAFAGLFALGRLRSLAQETLDTAREARLETTRQAAVWERNAGHVGRSLQEIQGLSRQMQRATLFKDGEIDLAISQLLTYKSISGDAFERTIKLGGDMAAVFGGIERSTMALARALDDPIRGLGDLRKAGYTFDDAVIKQVRSLTEQNRLFEAQRILLTELEKEVSGTAAAMKTGWVRTLDDAGKRWQKIKEWLGEVVAVPVATTFLGITNALIDLDSPLERSIRQLERFGDAAEAIVVVQLAQRMRQLRDEVRTLEREVKGSVLVVGSEAIVQTNGKKISYDTIDVGKMTPEQVDQEINKARAKLNAAMMALADAEAAGDEAAARAANRDLAVMSRRIDALTEFREKQETLNATTKELAETEESLGKAREANERRERASGIEQRIAALKVALEDLQAQGGETAAVLREIAALEKELAELRVAPAGTSAQGYKTAVATLEATFETRMTDLRERLARELIDKEQFEEQGREAAAAFNRGILSIIDQGGLTEDQRAELVDLLKDADGGKALAARRQLMEQLTDDVARLTETATQTALRELGKLEEKFRETFGGSIPAAAEEGLAKIRENIELGGVLEGLREEYRQIAEMKPSPEALASMQALVTRVREQRDAVDKTHTRWKELDALLAEMEKRAKTSEAEALVAPFKAVLDQEMAQLREQLARGLIDQKAFERAGREAGKVLRGKILEEIEKLRASGALSDEVYQALVGALPGETDPAKDAAERLRNLRDQARAIEEGARAGIQLANAFGVIDDKSAAALQNTTQLATSLIRLAGKDWTAIPSAIASLASLISGAAGSAERMQLVESQTALIRALDRLRDAVLQDITAAEKERLVSQGGSILAQAEKIDAEFQRRGGGPWKAGDLSPEALAVIKDIEQRTGIEIFKDGRVLMENFRQAMKALEEMDLGLFADDLMGQLDGLDWLFRTIGDDALTAAEKLARFLAVLQDNGAGDFATEFQRIIDEQGAEAAQAWLDSLVEGLVGDAGSLLGKGGIFDGLTAEQARRILEQAGGYLSGSGLVASGRPETRMAVNITATQADELLRVESTSLYVEQQQLAQLIGIHSLIAQMVSAPPPSFGAIPDISPPSPASLGLGGVQQMMTDLSGMTVEVHVAGEGITPGNARDMGERIGAGIGAGIGAEIDNRLRQAYRGSGASGPARVKVEVQ